MNEKIFFEQFGHLAESEGGIQKLRNLILQLAVQGKLVEQNPNDEPASELLRRIEEFRKNDNTFSKINKSISSTIVSDKNRKNSLPNGWVNVSLYSVGYVATGKTPPTNNSEYYRGTIPFIGPGEISIGGNLLSPKKFITQEALDYTILSKRGDILMVCIGGSIGKALIVSNPLAFNQQINLLRPILCSSEFIYRAISSKLFFNQVLSLSTGSATPIINLSKWSSLTIPIPPLAEQYRIVEKVDALMALCDRLEEEQKKQREKTNQSIVSTLHYLSEAETPKAFTTSFNILNKNFQNWFTTPESIKKLRATILQLAVQGKLVEQDPNDEPASELLRRVNKKNIQFEPSYIPYNLANGWAWACFPQLGIFRRGKSKHRPRNDSSLFEKGIFPFIQTGDVSKANPYIKHFQKCYNEKGLAQSALWQVGTLCITIAANIAESGILQFDACFPDSIVGFIPDDEFKGSEYFEFFIRTSQSRLSEYAPSTAQKNINLGILEKVAIPLPPLAEQHRIVEKVDALMALCDRLEEELINSSKVCSYLTDSLINHLSELTFSHR